MPKRKRTTTAAKRDDDIKYKGVKASGQRFMCQIRIDGTLHYLGLFDTPKEAAEAYDHAAISGGRPASTLNFPDQAPKDYVPKKKKLNSNNTLEYRGIFKRGNKYRAQIGINGKRIHLGQFSTMKEAAIAFDLAAIQAKRPKSDLNFPDMDYATKEIPQNKKARKVVKLKQRSYATLQEKLSLQEKLTLQSSTSTKTTGLKGVRKKGKKFPVVPSVV